MNPLPSESEINRLADNLLGRAGVLGRLPTPVDEIVAAAGLVEPDENVLSPTVFARAPKRIREAVSRIAPKVHAILDRKERAVHISPDHAGAGRPFKVLHEVVHDLLPWQRDLVYADNQDTLSYWCRMQQEREANVGAARLLFQGDFFDRVAGSYVIGMASMIECSERFGSSLRSGLRRYVEGHHGIVAGLVIERSPAAPEPNLAYRRLEAYASQRWVSQIRSPQQWPRNLDAQTWPFLFDIRHMLNVSAASDIVILDRNDAPVNVNVEILDTSYNHLIVLWPDQRQILKRRRRMA
jgi:hypothetical protein